MLLAAAFVTVSVIALAVVVDRRRPHLSDPQADPTAVHPAEHLAAEHTARSDAPFRN